MRTPEGNTIACGRVAERGFLPISRACQPPSASRAHEAIWGLTWGPTRGRRHGRAGGGQGRLPPTLALMLALTLALTRPSLGHFQQATRLRSAAAPPRSPRRGPLS